MSKLYVYGAFALIILGLVVGIYHEGSANAKATVELAQLQDQIKRDQKAHEVDLANARANQQIMDQMTAKTSDLQAYADSSKNGGSRCLTGADVDQLRNLWVNPAAPTK